MPKQMCINLHPAILPFYKGINVISGVIYNKEKITGLTLHKMEEKIDSGKIILIKKVSINDHETALSLANKLKKKVPGLINFFFKKIAKRNKILLHSNNSNLCKKFPKYIPNNGLINLNEKASAILNIFKASFYGPYKSTWGKLKININNKNYIIKDLKVLKKNQLQKKINKNMHMIKSKDKILKITI
jgi:methionyl-tRNA formyltransferase